MKTKADIIKNNIVLLSRKASSCTRFTVQIIQAEKMNKRIKKKKNGFQTWRLTSLMSDCVGPTYQIRIICVLWHNFFFQMDTLRVTMMDVMTIVVCQTSRFYLGFSVFPLSMANAIVPCHSAMTFAAIYLICFPLYETFFFFFFFFASKFHGWCRESAGLKLHRKKQEEKKIPPFVPHFNFCLISSILFSHNRSIFLFVFVSFIWNVYLIWGQRRRRKCMFMLL